MLEVADDEKVVEAPESSVKFWKVAVVPVKTPFPETLNVPLSEIAAEVVPCRPRSRTGRCS